MSLRESRMPSLEDKLLAEAEKAERKFEAEDKKEEKRSVIIKKKSKKNEK